MDRLGMRILIQLPNWLGDLVMSLGCVRWVAKSSKGAHIDAIVRRELAELVHYFPEINQIHAFDKQTYRPLLKAFRYGRALGRADRYTHYLSCSRSFSTAWLGYAIDARHRIGFRGDMRSCLMTHTYTCPRGMHRVDEYAYAWAKYMSEAPPEANTLDLTLKLPKPEQTLWPDAPLRIALNFNSASPSKTLPKALAISYLDALMDAYPQAHFLLLGTEAQRSYNASLLEAYTGAYRLHNYAGKTSLLELGQLLSEADLLISTDSGTAHLANSLSCPLIVLMGAGDEHNTGPYIQKKVIRLRAEGIACAPCVSVKCKWKEPKCLLAITPQLLCLVVEKLLP